MSTRGWPMAIFWVTGVCAFRGFTSTSPHARNTSKPAQAGSSTELSIQFEQAEP
jgi:hypothetical protein